MNTRTMTLILDDLDFDTIQSEITRHQVLSRRLDPNGPTNIPDGDSCLAGSIIAMIIRDLDEYRAMFDSRNPPTTEG